MPENLDLGRGKAAADGTMVFEGRGDSPDLAVQNVEGVAMQVQTVLHSSDGANEFAYDFGPDAVPVLNDDGSVDLLVELGGGGAALSVAHIEAPWAADANGREVNTSYRVEGSSIVQELGLTGQEAYPVVADPKLGWTWKGPTLFLNKTDTRRARDVSYVAAICAYAGVFAPLCGLNIAAAALWSRRAYNENKCSRFVFFPAGLLGEIYKGGYCK